MKLAMNKNKKRRGQRGPTPGSGGRPPEPNAKHYRLSLRLSRDDYESLEKRAKIAKKPVAAFARECLLENK
jgi:hypothetical protein